MSSSSTILPTSVSGSKQEQHKKGTKGFRKALLDSGVLVYLSPQNIYYLLRSLAFYFIERLALLLRFVPERLYPKLFYPIEDEIVSTTTRVIFTRRKQNRKPVCLKLWQFDNICNPKLVIKKINFLLEGFEFNRRFAPCVYLGIAPVYIQEARNQEKDIRRGKLMEEPKEQEIKDGVEYALGMLRLDESLRLDHQIYDQKLSEQVDFEFLAKEVARMHQNLDNSPVDKGTPETILSKLEINRELFEKCLWQLKEGSDFIEKYMWISELIALANARYRGLFQERHDGHHIKRCHGDLKTTNLWLEPENSYLFGLIKRPRQLFAIDCVDFNPEFCQIDTLSDLAMLVIDLEMLFLTDWLKVKTDSNRQEQKGKSLAKHFLESYLYEMQEDREKCNPLLEYYMTEKSMVCAYVSILYDERPIIGKKYLEVAYIHAKRLEKMLMQSASKNQTPLLAFST